MSKESSKRSPLADDRGVPKTEMLEAAKASIYFTDIVEKAHPVVSEYREIVTNFFEPGEKSLKILNTLARFEKEALDIWNFPDFMSDFKVWASVAMQKWLAKNPSLSQIGGATPRNAQFGRTVARWSQVDDIFIRGIRPGGSAVYYGEMGAGKTDIVTREVYGELLPTDWYITTNIPIKDMPEKAKFSTKLSSTFLHALERSVFVIEFNQDNPDKKLPDFTAALLDEQQFSMPKERGTSNRNLFMQQMTLLSRKLRLWQCGVYQQNRAPTIIDEFATHWVQKPDVDRQDIANLEIRHCGPIKYNSTITGIGPAIDKKVPDYHPDGIEFETFSAYVYTPDINPLRMFDFHDDMTTEPLSILDQKYKLIDYVKAHRGEKLDIISDDVITMLLWRIRNKLLPSNDKIDKKVRTLRYLSSLVGWKQTTLQSRFVKLEQSIKDGLIIPDDPEDVVKDMAGAIGVSDDEDDSEGNVIHNS